MIAVSKIYRYPIKGLSAQPLSSVMLEADKPFPHDRIFALARPGAPIDRDDPKWAKKGLFVMLMLDENLARVNTSLDLDSLRLTVRQGNQQVASAQLADAEDRARIENFFWQLLPTLPAAPALVRSPGGHFMDKPDNVISLINLATVRSLEAQWGVEIDPLRFRANIYIDGARPWEEFDWVGSEIRIGGAVFAVDRKNGRCGATNVNPTTGRRDLDIPGSLRAAFGHKNLGVYLIVRDGGEIAVGDSVLAPRSVPASPHRLSGAGGQRLAAPFHVPRLLFRLRGGERLAATVDQAGNAVRAIFRRTGAARIAERRKRHSALTSRKWQRPKQLVAGVTSSGRVRYTATIMAPGSRTLIRRYVSPECLTATLRPPRLWQFRRYGADSQGGLARSEFRSAPE